MASRLLFHEGVTTIRISFANIFMQHTVGFGLMKELVGMVIRDYLADLPDRPNPFVNGVPGKDWWQLFLKRWQSELSVQKPQQLPAHRALSATPEVLDQWFKQVENLFKATGLSASPADEL